MDMQEIIRRLQDSRKELDRIGVSSLRLFGSVARGEATTASDADFVVRFRGTPRFDQFMDLKFHLEQALGTRVDLVTEDAVRPELREAVERYAIRVA